MFDVGFWEISLIFVLALLILGPERLPRVAHSAGVWLGRARGAVRRLQREIQREIMIEETRAAVEKAQRAVTEPFAGSSGTAAAETTDSPDQDQPRESRPGPGGPTTPDEPD